MDASSSPSTSRPASASAVTRAVTAVRDRPVWRPSSERVRPGRCGPGRGDAAVAAGRELCRSHARSRIEPRRTKILAHFVLKNTKVVLVSIQKFCRPSSHGTDRPRATQLGALPAACDFMVFGGTGDLALRKLLPALYLRDREGQLPDDTRIVGVSRSGLDDDGYRDKVPRRAARRTSTRERSTTRRGAPAARRGCTTSRLDVAAPDDWHVLHGLLKDRPGHDETVRVFYLAVAPTLFGPICQRLDEIGLVDADARVVMEKPIGHDLASARAINDAVGRVFEESQIFRIDHYLGKESVQNLLVTRFANTFLEPLWNSHWIDHVQITVAESLGVGEPRRLLRRLRRAARHGAEPPAPAALPGRDGAADVRRPRDRARREAQGAPGAASRWRPPTSTATPCAAGTAPGWSTASPCRRTPTSWATASRHRDVRGAQGRGAELALGRRAVLPAHRQADGPPALGDRGAVQGAAAPDVPAQRGRHASRTGWSSSSSPTRACACT